MLLALVSIVSAGPLVVRTEDLSVANAGLVVDVGADFGFGNTTAGDGRPDGWAADFATGGVTISPVAGKARVAIAPGTSGTLCAKPIPVVQGRTLLLTTAVRGEADLGDVTALHMRILGEKGEIYTARRRFDTGDHGWEAVEIRATAPAGAREATLCLDVRMLTPKTGGALQLAPLQLVQIEAESRSARLPLARVILISVETFRWDHMHRAGYARATTPNLDRLAAEGAWFARNQAQAPYTHPSLASLITSRWPSSLGFGDNLPPDMLPDVRTAAELFAGAGYVTAAFNAQYTLSNRYGLNRGFHYYRNYPNDVPGQAINREAFGWLAAHAADNAFLWLHYFDPHGPYRPSGRFANQFEGDPIWEKDRMKLTASPKDAEGVPYIPNYVNDPGQVERRHYVAGYDGDIASVDDQIGKVVELVRANGWERDTMIVVTADHGESMTDHDRYFCHGSLFQHDLHTPLIVWAPGRVPAGREIASHTGNIDVLPTLLDYAGVSRGSDLQGESLRPLVEGARTSLQRPFTVSMVGKLERRTYAAIDDGRFKVLLDGNYRAWAAFNLEKDPNELLNLVPPMTGEVKAMTARVKTWLEELAKGDAPTVKTQGLDAEDLERLRAMGYVE